MPCGQCASAFFSPPLALPCGGGCGFCPAGNAPPLFFRRLWLCHAAAAAAFALRAMRLRFFFAAFGSAMRRRLRLLPCGQCASAFFSPPLALPCGGGCGFCPAGNAPSLFFRRLWLCHAAAAAFALRAIRLRRPSYDASRIRSVIFRHSNFRILFPLCDSLPYNGEDKFFTLQLKNSPVFGNCAIRSPFPDKRSDK